LYDWIGHALIRKTMSSRKLFPLLSAFASGFGAIASKRSEDGGEKIKGEGERKHKINANSIRENSRNSRHSQFISRLSQNILSL
jgi:hypothetical protein